MGMGRKLRSRKLPSRWRETSSQPSAFSYQLGTNRVACGRPDSFVPRRIPGAGKMDAAPSPGLRSSLCSFLRHGSGAPRPLAHELSSFVAVAPCRTVRPVVGGLRPGKAQRAWEHRESGGEGWSGAVRENTKRDRAVESHPCAKNAQGWGTPRWWWCRVA
jgi:hypothetical protein